MSWLGNRYPDLLPSLVILRKPLDEISDDRAENNLGVHMQCGAAAIGGHSHSVSTRPIVPPFHTRHLQDGRGRGDTQP